MITRQYRKSPFHGLWLPLLTAGFLGYFGFHAFSGSFGIWAFDRLERDTVRLTAELTRLKTERRALEQQVARVRPGNLDADVIDERARVALNLLRPDEVLIELGAVHQATDQVQVREK